MSVFRFITWSTDEKKTYTYLVCSCFFKLFVKLFQCFHQTDLKVPASFTKVSNILHACAYINKCQSTANYPACYLHSWFTLSHAHKPHKRQGFYMYFPATGKRFLNRSHSGFFEPWCQPVKQPVFWSGTDLSRSHWLPVSFSSVVADSCPIYRFPLHSPLLGSAFSPN